MGYADYKKRKKEEEEKSGEKSNQTSSRNYSSFSQYKESQQFGLDTLEDDLVNLGTTISNIYGGWHDSDTMNRTRTSVEEMQKRLNAYQGYQKKYGGRDLGEISSGYQSVLDVLDNLSSVYGAYKDADSFTKERTKLSELYSMSKDDLSARLNERNPIAYTTVGGQDITWQSLYDDKLHSEMATSKEGAQGWKKYLSDEEDVASEEREKKENQKWYEWIGEALGGVSDTTIPTSTMSQIVNEKRKDDSWQKPTDDWTKYEKNVFGAYYLDDPEKAYSYAHKLNNEKALANKNESMVDIMESATSSLGSGVGHAAGSLVAMPLGLADYLDDLTDMAAGRPIVEESMVTPFEYAQTVQGSQASKLNEMSGTLNEKVPVIGGKGLGDAYGVGMSIAQSMMSGKALGSAGTLISYFGQSAASGIESALERGASEETALVYGTVLGILEGIPEALTAKSLNSLGTAKGLKGFLANAHRQGLGELYEEGFTAFTGQMADNFFMKDKSEFNNAVRTYMANGMSEEEATKKAWQKSLESAAFDTLMGYVSGGISGGMQSVPSAITENSNIGRIIRENHTIDDLKNVASSLENDSYQKYIDLIESGKISDAKLGKFYGEVESEAKSKRYEAIDGAVMRSVANRANELGDSENSGIIASAITKYRRDGKLSAEEKLALKSDTAKTILGELESHELRVKPNERTSYEHSRSQLVKDIYSKSKSAEEKARMQRVKDLAKSETTMVNGETAKIEGIKVEDGVTTLLTSQGEAKAEDMTFSANDAEIVSHAEIMGNDKGNLFWSQYDGGADVVDYVDSFNTAYNYGRLGFDPETALKNRGVLTEAQASEIYKSAIRIEADARQKAIDDINTKYSGGVTVAGKFDDSIIDYDNGTADNSRVNWSDLSSAQRNAITFAKGFSKATGVNIKFIKSKVVDGEHKGANGIYRADKNTIEIDVYAGRMDAKALNDSIIPTLSHEMTHWMKAKSPAMYAKMRAHIGETLVLEGTSLEARIDAEIVRMASQHPNMEVTAEMAVDEIVARACEDMLSNSEKARELLSGLSESEQKSFIDKVKETFQNLMKWVNDLLSQYKSTSKEAEILRQYEDRLKELSKMWDKALEESIKTNQSLQKESKTAEAVINQTLETIGLHYDAKSETVFSYRSLEDAFHMENAEDFIKTKNEYIDALMKATKKSRKDCENYLNSLFLVHDMIGDDRDRLDYEAAVNKSAWVSNSEYGGSIDFSTLCAKRRLFTGTMDAIIEQLPNTVLTDTDFLEIRNRLLAKELEAPCSMCYVEGSRAKNAIYINNWLTEYKKTNPKWIPQLADFTSTVRLEQTRLKHPEAYEKYKEAMNKLAQRKPKEASVRTDYKGEIRVAFADGTSVDIKNKNGGIRFNSFSDFEIIHALDCMQVVTDMATVGLAGQGYTKVKEFAECFGNTGMKINLSLVAKDVDADGNLIFDEVNGMKYDEAISLRNRYPKNVGTVIVAFNHKQLKAALRDSTIDYVLPFHRSQWRKAQYVLMGLPTEVRDYTMDQNDRITNPKTKKPVKLAKLKHVSTYTNDITGETFEITDNIMPNQYWDYNADGVTNARRYLSYINSNKMTPKFAFLLEKDAEGNWVLPTDADGNVTAEGKGYFKVLIDFKMYDNDGVGSPQTPVVPDFNMPYINDMLKNYIGGHESFPVAHDVAEQFVADYKKNHPKEQYSDRMRGYDQAEDNDLAEFVGSVADGNAREKDYRVISNHISDRLAVEIQKIVGLNVRGYGNEIDKGQVEHILKEHGEHGRSDNSMADVGDIARIGYAIEHFDKIREGNNRSKYKNADGTKAKTVELQTRIGNNFYYVVEAVPDAKVKKLKVVSAYINKNDTFSEVAVSNDPSRYVQDESQSYVSNNIIPDSAENTTVSEQFSDRDGEVDSRTLLANALESIAQNDEEREKLASYKTKIERVNSCQFKLDAIRSQLAELQSMEKKDMDKIATLKKEASELNKKIDYYDRQLLKLEATEPLKQVVSRARKSSRERALGSYKDRINKKAKIESITQKALVLREWLTKNTKDKHIPEDLKEPVKNLLVAIDFASKNSGISGQTEALAEISKDIQEAKAKVDLRANLTELQLAASKSEDLQRLGVDFSDEIEELTKNISNVKLNPDTLFVLKDMSLDDLATLNKIITTLKTVVTRVNKFYTLKRKLSITASAHELFDLFNSLGDVREGNLDGVANFFNYENVTPIYFFDKLGEVGQDLFHSFIKAQDKMAFLKKEVQEFADSTWDAKDVARWDSDLIEFTVVDAKKTTDIKNPVMKKVYTTTSRLMTLYLQDQREQSKGHLYKGGGGRFTTFEHKGKKYGEDVNGVVLSPQLVKQMLDKLDPKAKQVADAISEFLNKQCKDWGNEITLDLYGTKLFLEPKYVPIEVIAESVSRQQDKPIRSITALLNKGFTKETKPNAKNQIVLDSIFDVFAKHTSEMMAYNAFAREVYDAVRLFEYKESRQTYALDGEEGHTVDDNIQTAMRGALGKGAVTYFRNFLEDINGTQQVGRGDNLLSKAFSNSKLANVAWNINVTLLQPLSLVRAMMMINPVHLARGTFHIPDGIKKAMEHSGTALWKSYGFYDTDISKGLAEQIKNNKTFGDRLKEASMKGPEVMDRIAWGALWKACEYQVSAKNQNLKKGSPEYYDKVVELFEEVVYRTQVMDSVLSKSQIMRSKSGIVKGLTSYMAEPLVSYNMVYGIFSEWNRYSRSGHTIAECRKMYGRKLAGAIGVYGISALAEAGLRTLTTAMRSAGNDEEEEDEKVFLEQLLENLNPLSKIPIGREISSVLQGYGVSSIPGLDTIETFVDAYKVISKMIVEDQEISYKKVHKILKALSYAYGHGASNAYRDVIAIWNSTIGLAYPSLIISTNE